VYFSFYIRGFYVRNLKVCAKVQKNLVKKNGFFDFFCIFAQK
ncbi:hypothetical protein OBE_01619, partial [human gut metagenome]